MTHPDVFDPGLQIERTSMAWRRTALSVLLGSIVALRLLPPVFDSGAAIAPGLMGVVFAGWLWRVSRRRLDAFVRQFRTEQRSPRMSGAAALLTLVLFSVGVGLFGIAAIAAAGG